jgi:phosphoribosyl 1,2-cyclic phosphodiesterase
MTSASDSSCRLTFHGVRGTAPAFGNSSRAHGGNTTCLEVSSEPAQRLLLDCGTGLRAVDRQLPSPEDAGGIHFDVLLTHYHMDHLMGLPAFRPLYDANNSFTFHGVGYEDQGLQATLESFLCPPWFPLALRDTPADKRYVDLEGQPVDLGRLRITYCRLNHPQGVTAYRLDGPKKAVLFATDCERGDAESDARFAGLAAGIDILIHDAQYTTSEYEQHCRGWGHSTWKQAVEAAHETDAGRLILFHHDPHRRDDELQAIVERAGTIFPAVVAARESMTLDL